MTWCAPGEAPPQRGFWGARPLRLGVRAPWEKIWGRFPGLRSDWEAQADGGLRRGVASGGWGGLGNSRGRFSVELCAGPVLSPGEFGGWAGAGQKGAISYPSWGGVRGEVADASRVRWEIWEALSWPRTPRLLGGSLVFPRGRGEESGGLGEPEGIYGLQVGPGLHCRLRAEGSGKSRPLRECGDPVPGGSWGVCARLGTYPEPPLLFSVPGAGPAHQGGPQGALGVP